MFSSKENENQNISFFLEEKGEKEDEQEGKKENVEDFNLTTMIHEMDDLLQLKEGDNYHNYNNNSELLYYVEKSVFVNEDETYYNEKYTLKELMKICCYYGIDKNIKASKCRKLDIIATIVFFEGQPENAVIVYKRHNMWAYMKELMTDPKMRSYLLWS
jgi:hypothetical protein